MAGFTRRAYKGAATATTLTASMSNVATSCTIAAYTGWPSGSDPFYVVISPGTAAEEKVLVTRTGATDTTLNVVTSGRGVDDTTAQSHDSGAAIFPVMTAKDADEANIVASTQTTKGDLLLHTGSAHARLGVGTNGQALVADSAETAGVKWAGVGDVTLTGTETLTNKTLTAPVVTSGVLVSPEERWTVSATAATGTVNVDVATTTAWYYTSNASANWTFNFRGDSGTTLASLLATGDSVTVAFAVTNGATAYYPTAFEVDGSAVTPMWQQGTAPAAGSASAVDLYVFTIIKTAATPTYAVFASQTKFD